MSDSTQRPKWDRQSASMERLRSQWSKRGGAVYLIRIGEVVKIGRSVNPTMRIKTLQLPQTPDEAHFIHADNYADCVFLEAALHEKFAQFRTYGEWFALSPLQVIEALAFAKDWQAA